MIADHQIYLVDDDEAVRRSLAFLLRSAGLEVREFTDPRQLVRAVRDEPPACVVTDVRMPEMTGLEVLTAVKDVSRTVPVLIITGHADIALAVEAMRRGAADFIEKPIDDERLLDAIRNAVDNVPHPSDADASAAARIASLSRRERDVLLGLVDGQANKTIARALELSPRTVEIYRAKLMTKMGAASYADLIRMAVQAGIGHGPG